MFEEKYMRFPGGLSKAVTLSYDDGVHADKKLMQIIDKYGLKCTFNLNSLLFDCRNWHDRMDEEETYALFSDSRHEVALHGARHIFLNKVPLHEAIREVALNRDWLEHKFGRIVNGMAYAYNGYNDEVKRVIGDLGVQYARTTRSTHSFGLPEDFLEWHPTAHHSEDCLPELTQNFCSARPKMSSSTANRGCSTSGDTATNTTTPTTGACSKTSARAWAAGTTSGTPRTARYAAT